ncbi:hypothetical protein KJY73_02260 [Bowmanella sp. Y26]|uniref:hypothetical protein n=1 Tax=Bowmanella yangjiangensis TaxID=2811230 RepID=UPI001BDC5A56|nr:hypothetical protein [Bowmanella yangjiangensis]MBT1062374.1 hypothetical protein [Bowmanella yangjiangensis]
MLLKPRLLMVGLLYLTSHTSLADCVGGSFKDRKNAFQNAESFRQLNQPWLAIQSYKEAQGYICDKDSENIFQQAIRYAAQIGRMHGDIAKQQGNLLGGQGHPPGAFEWYELGGHFKDADNALIAAVKASPDQLSIVDTALQHFSKRALPSFVTNNQAQIKVTGAYQVNPDDLHLVRSVPITQLQALLKQAQEAVPETYLEQRLELEIKRDSLGRNIASAMQLNQQAASFEQKWRPDPLEQVDSLLSQGRDWLRLVSPIATQEQYTQQVQQQHIALAKRLLRFAQSHELLSAAVSHMHMADAQNMLESAKAIASAQGDKAMTQGMPQKAMQFYQISEEYDKENQASALLEQQAEQDAQQVEADMPDFAVMQELLNDPQAIQRLQQQALEMQKQALELQKSLESQQQQDTDSLAKELGL